MTLFSGINITAMQEFLRATINASKMEREEHLKMAFEKFDLDGNEQISHDELTSALKSLGTKVCEVQSLVKWGRGGRLGLGAPG